MIKQFFNKLKNIIKENYYKHLFDILIYNNCNINNIAKYYDKHIKNSKFFKSLKTQICIDVLKNHFSFLQYENRLDKIYLDFYNDIVLYIPPFNRLYKELSSYLDYFSLCANFIDREEMIVRLSNKLKDCEDNLDDIKLIIKFVDTVFSEYNLKDEFNKYRMLVKLMEK